MPTSTKAPKNPKTAEAQPPFPQPQQPYPGYEDKMSPRADHGEESYKGSGKLHGYGTLITGADSGIGRAVALAFAREGADVLISYLSEDRDAEETKRLVEEAGRKAIVARGDIQDEATCRKLVDQAMKEFGRIDVLVNNAAYQTAIEKLEDYTAEHIDRCYRTNVFAMFYLAKAAVPHMTAGASIINTTSIQAYDPSPNLLDYASTKSAIIGFTKALSKLVVPQGIRVNAVAPLAAGMASLERPIPAP